MPDQDKVFAGSIPALYDRLLVPLIFQAHAEELAARVAREAPSDLLEIAAGTGAVTRALAPRLGADCRYYVTDLNEPMLAQARSRQGEDARISWRAADALALPFEDRSFDVVCCQFGVMFFPDRVAGYREALRVLRPGGRFLFNTWDRVEKNELTAFVLRATAELFPDDPPSFFGRTPHGYHDPERIRADVAAAGFREIGIEAFEGRGTAESAAEVALAHVEGTPFRNELEARGASLGDVTAHVTRRLTEAYGPGPVSGRTGSLFVTARA